MQHDEASAVDALRLILERWPGRDCVRSGLPPDVQRLLDDVVDEADFLSPRSSGVDVKRVAIAAGVATIEFLDSEGYPHRAELRADDSHGWKVLSCKFQCPVCFGSGTNDGERCETCCGNGWGV